MGYVLSPEKLLIAEAEPLNTVEGNTGCTGMRGAVALPGSETISRQKGTRRNLGDLAWPAVALAIPGRDGKARSQSRRGAGEGSDGLVVCAGQRPDQEGSSPSGARMRSAVSKSGGNASLAEARGKVWRRLLGHEGESRTQARRT